MSDQIVFEHPLNEKTRILLRLEHLLNEVSFHVPMPDAWSSRAAVTSVLDILSILGRTDLKSELLKELERHHATLAKIGQIPGVDVRRLEEVLGGIEQCRDLLATQAGSLSQGLKDHDLLKAIQQRRPIPGGSCAFDLPQLHHWLEQPHEQRAEDLRAWRNELAPLERTVRVLLTVIRGSSERSRETAAQGFFQMALDAQAPVHLVQVLVAENLGLFAEISGGKHRFSIRFMEPRGAARSVQALQDVPFTLACCAI